MKSGCAAAAAGLLRLGEQDGLQEESGFVALQGESE